ncbi:MAG: hypothetical protein JEZ05_01590 [Tenericutes bacterium]|nr:hypothetical protein [Mycoplasmatota bacterium]
MPKLLDSYQQWEKDGVLKKKLKEIEELASKRIIQRELAESLGISEKTFIGLKRKHPKIKDAIYKGKEGLKKNLLDSMYQLAIGAFSEDTKTNIEKDGNGKRKERIEKHNKKEKPDYKALRYLLITNFGREYNEKKRELDLMEKRLNAKEDDWTNASDDEEE